MMITTTSRTCTAFPDSTGSETVPSAPSSQSIKRITTMVQSMNSSSPIFPGVLMVAANGSERRRVAVNVNYDDHVPSSSMSPTPLLKLPQLPPSATTTILSSASGPPLSGRSSRHFFFFIFPSTSFAPSA